MDATPTGVETDGPAETPSAVDADTLRALFEQHRGRIRSVFGAIGAPAHDADDLTQEVFVRALAGLERLDDPARACAWLYGIVRNLRLQYHQRRCREAARRQGAPVERATPDDSPLERSLAGERAHALRAAVAELAPEHQQLLALRYRQTLSYRDIAEQLGISVALVGVRLHRLCSRLRDQLSETDA